MNLYKYINLQKMDTDSLYKHLINDTTYTLEEIEFVLYDLYNYDPSSKLYELKEKRKKQDEFHKQLIIRDKQCIITNKTSLVCQACHIIPYALCNENEKYDINNGLLLSADTHILFDKYMISINPITSTIYLINELLDDDMYNKYHNKKITLNDKQKKYLLHHWNIFNNNHVYH
jgi:hypothetical protein